MRQMTGGWEAGGGWEVARRQMRGALESGGVGWEVVGTWDERRVWQADGGWHAEEADDSWLRGGWQLGKQMRGA